LNELLFVTFEGRDLHLRSSLSSSYNFLDFHFDFESDFEEFALSHFNQTQNLFSSSESMSSFVAVELRTTLLCRSHGE
jgi:hypothetical protein